MKTQKRILIILAVIIVIPLIAAGDDFGKGLQRLKIVLEGR